MLKSVFWGKSSVLYYISTCLFFYKAQSSYNWRLYRKRFIRINYKMFYGINVFFFFFSLSKKSFCFWLLKKVWNHSFIGMSWSALWRLFTLKLCIWVLLLNRDIEVIHRCRTNQNSTGRKRFWSSSPLKFQWYHVLCMSCESAEKCHFTIFVVFR